MKKTKRLLSLILSICMLLSITAGIDFSVYALSSSGYCGENVTYIFDSSTGKLVISGNGAMDDSYYHSTSPFYRETKIKSVEIQAGVTSIGKYVFEYCMGLTSVTIPDSVTSIGNYAFDGCYGLTSVTIPDSVKSIGNYAFSHCIDLKNVTIGNSVDSIGENAFSGCDNLTSVNIPDSVISIDDYAFSDCLGLKNVTIGNSVASIGKSAFKGCVSLVRVSINSIDAWCNIIFGDIFSNPLLYTGKLYLNNKLVTTLTISNSVKSIGNYAFYKCTGLKSISIPDSVTCIGDSAFYSCGNLTSVTIGNGVTNIGDYAFYGCSSLLRVNINSIAAWCNIEFGKLDSNPLVYAQKLYLNNTLVTDLVIPNSVTNIGKYVFYQCTGLKSVLIPDSVTSIGPYAFEGCDDLKYYDIGKNVDFSNLSLPWNFSINANSIVVLRNEDFDLEDFIYALSLPKSTILCAYESTGARALCENYEIKYVSLDECNKGNHTSMTVQSKTPATNTKDGKIVKKCACGAKSTTTIKKVSTVKLSTTKYTYDGKVKSPTLTVKDSAGKALVKGTDYTVTTPSGRKNVGKYTYKITFKGNYSGTKSLSFVINPKNTSISKLTATKGGFKATIKKYTTQTTGYQIQIATDSGFTKGIKSYTVTSNSTVSKKITKLTGGKKYYVRIRTYKTVSGTKYYSSWSVKKYVTTKKQTINNIENTPHLWGVFSHKYAVFNSL